MNGRPSQREKEGREKQRREGEKRASTEQGNERNDNLFRDTSRFLMLRHRPSSAIDVNCTESKMSKGMELGGKGTGTRRRGETEEHLEVPAMHGELLHSLFLLTPAHDPPQLPSDFRGDLGRQRWRGLCPRRR